MLGGPIKFNAKGQNTRDRFGVHPEPQAAPAGRAACGQRRGEAGVPDAGLELPHLSHARELRRATTANDDDPRPMPLDLVVNVLVSGLLTGLVYGLMALGLSVIFGVVRIVNFAHGEMMALAMYVDRRRLRRAEARSAVDAAAGGGGVLRPRLRCCSAG